MKRTNFLSMTKSRGLAMIETVIILPLLLILVFGVVELGRAIQAHNIVTNLSREGANTASRSILVPPQVNMDALALSSPPLDLSQDGVIFISVVVGVQNSPPFLQAQHRWLNFGDNSSSQIWANCSSWDAQGECILPDPKPNLPGFPMALDPGQTVYVVEVFYDYAPLTSYVVDQNIKIYSRGIM